jgi:hypothetical protein
VAPWEEIRIPGKVFQNFKALHAMMETMQRDGYEFREHADQRVFTVYGASGHLRNEVAIFVRRKAA